MWLAAEAAVAPDIASMAASTSEADLFIIVSPAKESSPVQEKQKAGADVSLIRGHGLPPFG
jgi:hypothetical protein